jgi:cytochrome b pre-mRNA-processing protein 3
MIANTFRQKIAGVFFGSQKTRLDPHKKAYYKCLEASRRQEFYTEFEVADTFDGRFDMLCLVISIYMQKLSQDIGKTKQFSQNLFDAMFKDIDLTLREMGAGDLGVGKRVKVMSESFMGRLTKYSQSVENKDATMLADTLSRNLYRKTGSVKEDSTITQLVLNFYEQMTILEVEYLISEDFNMNDFIATCLDSQR